jgi:hypothetical protein
VAVFASHHCLCKNVKKTEKKAEYVAWKPKNINKSKRGKEFFEAKRNFFACQF